MFGSLTEFGRLLERRARYKGYREARAAFENLSDADLQDIGAKRYQLGAIARSSALK